MKKISTFFYIFKNTFSSLSYYKDVIKAPFSFSLKFFILYFFFYALVGTIVSYSRLSKGIDFLQSDLINKVQEIYPSNLEIKIKDGIVSANTPQPYILSLEKVNQSFSQPINTKTPLVNLFVIDTNGSVENFSKYKTAALLTRNYFVLYRTNRLNVYSFEKIQDLTINKSFISSAVLSISPFLLLIKPIVLLIIFLSFFVFVPAYELLYLLFFAFVLFIISRLIKASLSYGKLYQIGLHLIVVSSTIFGFLYLINIRLSLPFLETILLCIFGLIILKSLKTSVKTTKRRK